MDKGQSKWGWLPAFMPGVVRLMKDKRRELGDAYVNTCWQRGVVERQRGWFFAREGAVAVGLPDKEWLEAVYMQPDGAAPAVLFLGSGEGAGDGTH